MRFVKIAILIIVGLGIIFLGAYLRNFKKSPDKETRETEEVINRWDANRILREMRATEATATTTEAIQYRLGFAKILAEEGDEINITDCFANPLVLKSKNGEEIRLDNKKPKKLILLMNEKDYYIIQPNSFLTLKLDFTIENNNNLIRFICGEGDGAPTSPGYILLE